MKLVRLVLGPILTNCYLLLNEETGQIAVVDPADHAQKILSAAGELGGRITAILLTHGHYDHIGAVEELKEATDASVWAHQAEERTLADPEYNLSGGTGRSLCIKADHLVKDDQVFEAAGFSFRAFHTPGHTEGGCCYYLEKEGLLFSGDTLFDHSIGRTDFPGGDMKTLVDRVKEKLFVLPDDTWVLPGHDEVTKIGIEKRENPFFCY